MFTYRIRRKASATEEPEEYIGLGEAILTGRKLGEPYEVVSTLAGRKLVMYDSDKFPPKKGSDEEASE
ncbi:MAG: hypothetical protein KGI66_00690 [Patescibacteria group bacterium]|nr:hypothetical protein [Patescibacteria group bacterium]